MIIKYENMLIIFIMINKIFQSAAIIFLSVFNFAKNDFITAKRLINTARNQRRNKYTPIGAPLKGKRIIAKWTLNIKTIIKKTRFRYIYFYFIPLAFYSFII